MPQTKKGYAGSAANLAKWREQQRALKEQQQSQYVLYDSDDEPEAEQQPIVETAAKPIVIETEKPKTVRKPRVNKTDELDKKFDQLMQQFSNLTNNMQKTKAEPEVPTPPPAAPIVQQQQQQQQQQQFVRPMHPLSAILKHNLMTKF
ncbi:hypothetical protein SAMD00019534_119190 [Acytostelium subglobosum LB1]|uniref:hypothetical protein n=1 Tax=Acytostelium subglobosum LB1 TaxID=1410327 RepID=UPI0006447D06|nr:hypothetical protein SAMD00019534_119190 [Acytostelium subglobosum LB1]GAM28743.1 hypothetical protein SAMD00019534_119190 [Acytostelium subglobosum LB1]|eukprot:XP_012748298.1 hypothetical protein SAMD00019534_119190 [Acytostelium subglobosum LB1]